MFLLSIASDPICSGFPEGKYRIQLESSSSVSSRDHFGLQMNIDHQIGIISGGGSITLWGIAPGPPIIAAGGPIIGFHDCEHAYFEMRFPGELAHVVCTAWGTGSATIDEFIATCTYVPADGTPKTAIWTAKLVPIPV